jgi:hypothetical protein
MHGALAMTDGNDAEKGRWLDYPLFLNPAEMPLMVN